MNIKYQVISLDLAKKLKELGVKQASLWYWNSHGKSIYSHKEMITLYAVKKVFKEEDMFSALTVAELGKLLGDFTSIKDKGTIEIRHELMSGIFGDTEANARAKCLQWLIENKHIEL